jgi:hypothetical protein
MKKYFITFSFIMAFNFLAKYKNGLGLIGPLNQMINVLGQLTSHTEKGLGELKNQTLSTIETPAAVKNSAQAANQYSEAPSSVLSTDVVLPKDIASELGLEEKISVAEFKTVWNTH